VRAFLVAALATACAFLPREASAAPEKRPVPDYDGRGEKKTTVGDVLLWPPRIVVFPLYLTSEYVLRRPIGALATTAEKHRWPTKIIDFFTFGEEQKAGIVPTGYYEFGFRPSIGAYFFWDDVGFKGHQLRAHAGTWGPTWISAALTERFRFRNDRAMFSWQAEYIHRADGMFNGIGPRTLERDVSRFGFTRLAFAPAFDVNLGGLSTFHTSIGVRNLHFRNDDFCCSDLPIRDVVARGTYDYPPGFLDGYTLLNQMLELTIDTRKATGPSSGIRASFDFEHAGEVGRSSRREWVRYGAQVGGFLALDNHGRSLALIVAAAFADPLAGDIPFTEQVNLPYAGTVGAGISGIGSMRGFRPGRLVDRSALVATLQYTWPIWIFLDGTVHLAAGNVWGNHLSELDAKLMRFSTGIGFRTAGSPDHSFEVLFGTATETIADGLRPNSIRVLAGATRGF
jgi:hypothetical protein